MKRPAPLVELPEAHRVDLDVRAEIAGGREPFTRIMATVKALGADQALVLRVPFEPLPLYEVLGRRGFAHWTERADTGDWSVWFYRDADLRTGSSSGPVPAPFGARVILDVRGLEPPQPMVRVLQEAQGLAMGAVLEVLHERRPIFLYPQLEERGFDHDTDEPEPGLIRILVRRRES
jgi:uncharacterized protein (DUF2249 family)